MSQPVKLSDELVLDARLIAELTERSIAGQIEFWARLGRAIEPLLSGNQSLALRKSGDQKPLSELISAVDTPEGRRRVSEYLGAQPFPHYETSPEHPGMLVRIEQTGARTIGKFVNRQFQPVTKPAQSPAKQTKSRATKPPATPTKPVVAKTKAPKAQPLARPISAPPKQEKRVKAKSAVNQSKKRNR